MPRDAKVTVRRTAILWLVVSLVVTLMVPPRSTQGQVLRPILYDDFDETTQQFVTSAVYFDGRQQRNLIRASGATWSPDGKWFACVTKTADGGHALNLRNLTGDQKTMLTTGRGEAIFSPMWSPDGRNLPVILLQPRQGGADLNSLAVLDTSNYAIISRREISAQTIHLPYFFSPPGKFEWSPDGRKILISWENVIVIDDEAGRIETIAPDPAIAEWAPDSSGVYYFAIKDPHNPRTRRAGHPRVRP